MRAPANSPITLGFGSTESPYSAASPHKGVDFAYLPDDTIYAPFTGRVSQVPNNGNDGNGTYMTDDQGRYHGLLHASQYLVPNGTVVKEGQPIAKMGETGYAFGKHLHWAVKENGKFIDGLTLIKGGAMPASQDIADETMIRLAYNLGLNRDATPDEVKQRVDAQQTAEQLMRDIWTSQEHIDLLTRQDGQVKDLQSQVDDLAHKLNVVQALNGDATKWQTLKTLIKELVS